VHFLAEFVLRIDSHWQSVTVHAATSDLIREESERGFEQVGESLRQSFILAAVGHENQQIVPGRVTYM
jgi:hypothetical protein